MVRVREKTTPALTPFPHALPSVQDFKERIVF